MIHFRSLNRQQSWSNNPTQSNSFKIIQKITQTDDDEEDENAPITEHGPRYPQNFQQLPADQMRRMKLNEGDQNLMNKFKQGRQGKYFQIKNVMNQARKKHSFLSLNLLEIHYHDEENPRYRGGHIPSKVFRILDESGIYFYLFLVVGNLFALTFLPSFRIIFYAYLQT